MRELWRKLRNNRNQLDEDLAEELRFHLEERADELASKGLTRTQALRQARLELGTPVAIREESKDQWSLGWIEDWYTDTLQAARGFAKQPGFVLAAVLSFGLGIGVNLALFGIASQLILSDPSVQDPASLYSIRFAGSSHLDANVFRTLSESNLLPGVTGYTAADDLNWRSGEDSTRLFGIAAAPNYFSLTGTPLAQGRGFSANEPYTAVISDSFWRKHLGSDPQALGKPLWLNGAAHTIIGILPADYRSLIGFGFSPDLFFPAPPDKPLQVVARFPAATPRQQLISQTTSAARVLDSTHPNLHSKYQEFITAASFAGVDRLQAILRPAGIAAIGLVGAMFLLILLIACANVASLLLARTAARSQDLAIRSSLGATPARLLRLLLAETLLLSFGGSLAGIGLYFFFTRFIGTLPLPIPIPLVLRAETNWASLAYALLLAILAAWLAGLIPAWRASRRGIAVTLKASEHQVAAPSITLRRWLLGAQIAASILLLSTGLLFVRNLAQTTKLDPGFRLDTLWTRMTLVPSQFKEKDKIAALTSEALRRLRADPRIESAAFASVIPFNDQANMRTNVHIDMDSTQANYRFNNNTVSSAYFATMGIPLLEGREFSDTNAEAESVILSKTFASRLFGGKSAVGRRIFLQQSGGAKPYEIIGVVADIKHMGLGEEGSIALYRPMQPNGDWRTQLDLVARPRAASAATARIMRAILLDLSASSAVETKRLGDSLGLALLPSQAGAIVFSALGLLGLALSAVGLHGTVTFSVRQRSSEIGLRMALGASPAQILGLIAKENCLTLLAGGIAGTALAIAVARPLAFFLVPGMSSVGPASFAAILLGIGLVATIAILGPARRAMRIDPLEALRSS